MTSARARVVCLSGSLQPRSRTENLTIWCASRMAELGADVSLFAGADLDLPHYRPIPRERGEPVLRMLAALASCDGVLLASPAYHGTVSGVLKNALDYVNDLEHEPKPFLDGRPIGCLVVASRDQGATTTLATLRTIAHALRGWPTPLGVTAWGPAAAMSDDGPVDERIAAQLEIMLAQLLTMATLNARRRHRTKEAAKTSG